MFLLNGATAYAQGDPEEVIKKKAEKFWEDEDYENGYKSYSLLLSYYPKDPVYNYRCGVCMLFYDKDKKKCYPYLEFANKHIKECEKEAKFYLAKAYHLNFRFDDAIKLYTDYKSIGSSSNIKKLHVDQEIQSCKNGKRLMSTMGELIVLEKKQIAESEYFRSYNLKSVGGKLLVTPAEFQSGNDKKKKNKSIIYIPQTMDQVYYASYGDGDNKDIFIVRKLPNGSWSKPESIGAPINTEFDEDYPFLHPNGRVLYFASKGHNSMGGYDIFKSIYNESTDTWGTPINMDFPINTPSDDYLFVTDSTEKTAYFSSNRQSPIGKVDVFKISTERKVPEFAYIKGTVLKSSMDQSMAARITIKNMSTGENAGTFTAESSSGNYLLKVPNGGNFMFTVETPGFSLQTEGVKIPQNTSLIPFKQTISYDDKKLVIKNSFDIQGANEESYKDYIDIIEEKSKLDVNASDYTNNAPLVNNNGNNTETNNGVTTNNSNTENNSTGNNSENNVTENNPDNTNGNNSDNSTAIKNNSNLNNQQLEEMAFNDAKELNVEAEKLKSDADDAYTFVNNKKTEALEKKQEADKVLLQANSEKDPAQKENLLTQASDLNDEAKKMDDQAKIAETIAKQLDQDANNKRKEAELQEKYAEQLKEVNKSKNNKDALKKLEAIQKELEQFNDQNNGNSADLTSSIKNEAARKDEEISVLEPKINSIKEDLKNIETEISSVDKEISSTKDKDLLENLKAQKEELNTELINKKTDLKKNEDQLTILKKESEDLNSQADFANSMMNEVTADGSLTPISNNNVTDNNTGNNGNTDVNNNNAITNNPENNGNANNVTESENKSTEEVLAKIATEGKQYGEELKKLDNQPESANKYQEKNQVINSYINNIDKEIADINTALNNTTNSNEKEELSQTIKDLEQKKTMLNDTKSENEKKIQTLSEPVVTNNTAGNNTETNNTTGNNNTETNNNNAGNNSDINNATITENPDYPGLSDNNEKITSLNSEADNLYQEANNLRKENKNLSGAQKEENKQKIKELEEQAAAKKYDVALLVAKDNENKFAYNQDLIEQYKNAGGNPNNVVMSKVNSLLGESQTLYDQAIQIEEEANAEPNVAAKSASYSNVEEKEILALEKQREAIKLLKKSNPDFVPKQNNENNIANNNVNADVVEKNNALIQEAQNNESNYNNLIAQLDVNQKKGNGNSDVIEQKRSEAVQLANEGKDLITKANASQDPKEKNQLISQANNKFKEANAKVNEANTESEKQIKAANDNAVTNSTGNNGNNTENNGNNNAVTSNTGNNGNNTGNNGNNDAVTNNTGNNGNNTGNNGNNDTVTNNTGNNGNNTGNNGNNNAVTNNTGNNGNNTGNNGNNNVVTNNTGNNAAATNTVTPNGNLSPAQVNAIKNTPAYKNHSALNSDVIKYEGIADKEDKKALDFYQQATMYLKESNDLRIQLDDLPESDEKKLKQDQAIQLDRLANRYKAKGDSVKGLAMDTRGFADSKKAELEAYEQALDPKTLSNIKAVDAQANTNVAVNNNATEPSEFSNNYKDESRQFEEELNNTSGAEENEANLTTKNNTLKNYNLAIDKEISNKKQTLPNANAADKKKINDAIKVLEAQKAANNKLIASNNKKINNLKNSTAANNPNSANNNNPGNTNNSTPNNSGNIVSVSGVTIKNGNAYSSSNPIPIDEKLPDGLIFAVQIGAFKNPIPDNLFRGLSPMRGERTNSGFIRYQAGRFTEFDKANAVKNDLRKLGYKDAFVVAYRDGQKINVGDAINELKSKGQIVNNNPNSTAGITANSNVPTADVLPQPNNANTTAVTNNTPAAASEVSQVQGLFFTVQIGVYSATATTSQLLNLKPVYREQIPSGYYRYTAGIYSNLDKVKTDRAKVNALGIPDAFVSAYQNGQRIKIADAISLINSGTSIKFPSENPIQFGGINVTPTNPVVENNPPVNNNNPTNANNNAAFTNGVTQGPQPTEENGVKVGDQGITYKVQIGAYKNQVPKNVADNFLKIKEWPIKSTQINGLYIYTVGSFIEAKYAKSLWREAKNSGISDAFITVYKDGKKLYGAEAASYMGR